MGYSISRQANLNHFPGAEGKKSNTLVSFEKSPKIILTQKFLICNLQILK